MAAAPFTGTLQAKVWNPGRPDHLSPADQTLTFSDVANEQGVFTDVGTNQVSFATDILLLDLSLSTRTGAEDTKKLKLRKGSMDGGWQRQQTLLANLTTDVGSRFGAPFLIRAGQMFGFVQLP